MYEVSDSRRYSGRNIAITFELARVSLDISTTSLRHFVQHQSANQKSMHFSVQEIRYCSLLLCL
jgi:hypothetical protein